MTRLRTILASALLASALICRLQATGYYGPDYYLDRGGKNVDASPEFYWDLEAKRIAREFHPAEKLHPALSQPGAKELSGTDARKKFTADADVADFAAALKEGRIKPPDPARAQQEHEAARQLIAQTDDKTTASLPEESASEFADYHRGAFAYRLGPSHWEEARQAWTELLARPAEERHYRTIWATFMLGRLALKNREPEASTWFEQTRELARQGFADSLGMAADSYGWEGRSEWKQNRPEKAAPLFLTQLALGDESAVISLKALIPDRAPVEGMLNYGPEPEDRSAWNEQQKREQAKRDRLGLEAAARDPLLRRLVTAHILATSTGTDYFGEDSAAVTARSTAWLEVIKAAKLGSVPDAEYLGWAAYSKGDYKDAAHWLELAGGESPAAAWLRAKLERRAGKLADAAKSMAEAWQSIHDVNAYTGWTAAVPDEFENYGSSREGPSWSFPMAASGDLAGLRLVRGDFVQALDTFLKNGLWNDAAFVAERVLTTGELKKYVDELPATAPSEKAGPEHNGEKLRYLLGRRLVREDQYEEAARYLTPPFDKIVQIYAKALHDGADAKLPKAERAAAWFHAAWIARHDGMELMGAEVAPDGFVTEGNFDMADLAKERLSGKYQTVRYEDGQEKTTATAISLKPSQEELQRLAKTRITPDVRFHYRLIAGALAMKAAQLLADNSDELADVVNTAGNWVKDRDEKIGNQYFHVMELRCAKTTIGRAALPKHWFVEMPGPWSDKERQAYEAMHNQLGLPKRDQ